MGFAMPTINDNKEGWGPGTPPEKFDGMPYAPFEKRAFIGRMADWSARAEQYRERMRNRPAAVRRRSRPVPTHRHSSAPATRLRGSRKRRTRASKRGAHESPSRQTWLPPARKHIPPAPGGVK
eukprot:1883882-Prymnesium_polylepis.2